MPRTAAPDALLRFAVLSDGTARIQFDLTDVTARMVP
jgi:hypothetical protein